jgi:hypothetical protein
MKNRPQTLINIDNFLDLKSENRRKPKTESHEDGKDLLKNH